MTERGTEARSWKTPEFVLVVVMLVVLVALVVAVLYWPVKIPSGDSTTMANVLDYRKGILSVIITAFGAWVGAGAAYFFGRENLREAASSLLAMREESPRERLRRVPVREVPPRIVKWLVTTEDTMGVITDKLKAKPSYWFVPIVDDKEVLETVIEEEAVWRLLDLEMHKQENLGKTVEQIDEAFRAIKVGAGLALIREIEGLERFTESHVVATLEKSAAEVYEAMQSKGVKLAIVVDEQGKPTHFFTTGDVREVLMQVG